VLSLSTKVRTDEVILKLPKRGQHEMPWDKTIPGIIEIMESAPIQMLLYPLLDLLHLLDLLMMLIR